ncbi:MAG: iron ABC transporter permease [archaeon]|nr:iron ABC transporter permease [archaeon]
MIKDDPLIGVVVRGAINEWLEGPASADEGRRETLGKYRHYILRRWVFLSVCAVATFLLAFYTLTIGDYSIDFWECFTVVWNHITGDIGEDTASKLKDYVVCELRLPTAIVGVIAGMGLAVCGVAMQSILKNPLADPYTTGVSSGAGFGATLAIVAGASIATSEYAIIANAFVFSLVPTFVILLMSKIRNASPTTMIMAGVAIMYIFNASSTIIKLWGDPNSLAAILEWQVGSIGGIKWHSIPLILSASVVGLVTMQLMSRKLNVLATGEDGAKALGLDVDRLRAAVLVIVALVAATIVSFTGLIGFIGLVAPHVCRIVIGADNRYLVPVSAFMGAAVLLAANIAGKVLLAPSVLPVGVLTAFLGGPLFLWLILRRKTEVWG